MKFLNDVAQLDPAGASISPMTNTTITNVVEAGKLIVRADDPNRRTGTVLSEAQTEAFGFITGTGTFVVNTGTDDNPYFVFAALTGRTRRQWNMDMPTINTFEVETVVLDINGRPTIMGIPAPLRRKGIWMTRPENVVTR